jgi:hypothetical protein
LTAQHVSSDIIAHYQERLNYDYSFLFYPSLSLPAAVLAEWELSDIIAHHQELLNCNYSFWFYTRLSLPAAVMAGFPLI